MLCINGPFNSSLGQTTINLLLFHSGPFKRRTACINKTLKRWNVSIR